MKYKTKNDFFVFISEVQPTFDEVKVQNKVKSEKIASATANTTLRQADTAPYTANWRAR